jgi:hypothetical protein
MFRKFLQLIIVVPLFALGGVAMALEEPDYEVLLKTDEIEFRRYEPYLVAEVTVSGKSAGNEAFRVLAGYIFGDNDGDVKMQMTAPVESRDVANGEHVYQDYAFVMEKSYSLDSLPVPNDERIRIRERPSRIVAVREFSGRWSEQNISRHQQDLLDDLRSIGVEITGSPELARYNSPFTPWFLRRNEIVVPVSPASVNELADIATGAPARL